MSLRIILAIVLSALWAFAGAALEAPLSLYQTKAVTSGTMPDRRALGFALCLRDVMVKVSGDPRLADDPAVIALAGKADQLITDFSFRDRLTGVPMHDEQGSYDRPHDLTCTFDAGKIDAALAGLGRKPWPLPRPAIVFVLAVRDMKGNKMLLTEDRLDERGVDMRTSLLASAARLGLDVRLPTRAEIAAVGEAPEKIGGATVLAGRLDWSDAALGWVAEWRVGDAAWRIKGVGFDDAFRNGLGGAAQVLSGNGVPG